MKTLSVTTNLIITVLIITILSSCEDWNLVGMKGSGPIVTNDVEMDRIEGINLEIPASVYLTQGDTQKISFEGQENIINNINITTSHGVMKLKFDQPVSKAEPVNIYITLKSLTEASISGAGLIQSDGSFSSDNTLTINVSGKGTIKLNADARYVDMNISGMGKIELRTQCEELIGKISGMGDINLLEGSTNKASYYISGMGNINAYDFATKSCNVQSSGAGDAKVWVNDFLNVNISGSGSVHYKGNPQLSVKISGAGKVEKVF